MTPPPSLNHLLATVLGGQIKDATDAEKDKARRQVKKHSKTPAEEKAALKQLGLEEKK
ncbi:hypothetical protein GCM10027059_26810 [Myceligenerans halotolerans]